MAKICTIQLFDSIGRGWSKRACALLTALAVTATHSNMAFGEQMIRIDAGRAREAGISQQSIDNLNAFFARNERPILTMAALDKTYFAGDRAGLLEIMSDFVSLVSGPTSVTGPAMLSKLRLLERWGRYLRDNAKFLIAEEAVAFDLFNSQLLAAQGGRRSVEFPVRFWTELNLFYSMAYLGEVICKITQCDVSLEGRLSSTNQSKYEIAIPTKYILNPGFYKQIVDVANGTAGNGAWTVNLAVNGTATTLKFDLSLASKAQILETDYLKGLERTVECVALNNCARQGWGLMQEAQVAANQRIMSQAAATALKYTVSKQLILSRVEALRRMGKNPAEILTLAGLRASLPGLPQPIALFVKSMLDQYSWENVRRLIGEDYVPNSMRNGESVAPSFSEKYTEFLVRIGGSNEVSSTPIAMNHSALFSNVLSATGNTQIQSARPRVLTASYSSLNELTRSGILASETFPSFDLSLAPMQLVFKRLIFNPENLATAISDSGFSRTELANGVATAHALFAQSNYAGQLVIGTSLTCPFATLYSSIFDLPETYTGSCNGPVAHFAGLNAFDAQFSSDSPSANETAILTNRRRAFRALDGIVSAIENQGLQLQSRLVSTEGVSPELLGHYFLIQNNMLRQDFTDEFVEENVESLVNLSMLHKDNFESLAGSGTGFSRSDLHRFHSVNAKVLAETVIQGSERLSGFFRASYTSGDDKAAISKLSEATSWQEAKRDFHIHFNLVLRDREACVGIANCTLENIRSNPKSYFGPEFTQSNQTPRRLRAFIEIGHKMGFFLPDEDIPAVTPSATGTGGTATVADRAAVSAQLRSAEVASQRPLFELIAVGGQFTAGKDLSGADWRRYSHLLREFELQTHRSLGFAVADESRPNSSRLAMDQFIYQILSSPISDGNVQWSQMSGEVKRKLNQIAANSLNQFQQELATRVEQVASSDLPEIMGLMIYSKTIIDSLSAYPILSMVASREAYSDINPYSMRSKFEELMTGILFSPIGVVLLAVGIVGLLFGAGKFATAGVGRLRLGAIAGASRTASGWLGTITQRASLATEVAFGNRLRTANLILLAPVGALVVTKVYSYLRSSHNAGLASEFRSIGLVDNEDRDLARTQAQHDGLKAAISVALIAVGLVGGGIYMRLANPANRAGQAAAALNVLHDANTFRRMDGARGAFTFVEEVNTAAVEARIGRGVPAADARAAGETVRKWMRDYIAFFDRQIRSVETQFRILGIPQGSLVKQQIDDAFEVALAAAQGNRVQTALVQSAYKQVMRMQSRAVGSYSIPTTSSGPITRAEASWAVKTYVIRRFFAGERNFSAWRTFTENPANGVLSESILQRLGLRRVGVYSVRSGESVAYRPASTATYVPGRSGYTSAMFKARYGIYPIELQTADLLILSGFGGMAWLIISLSGI